MQAVASFRGGRRRRWLFVGDGQNGFVPTVVQGLPLTDKEQRQIASIRRGLEGGAEEEAGARRTLLRLLTEGKLRRTTDPIPPPAYVPVWVDRMRCNVCGRPEAALRKLLTRRDVRIRVEFPLWLLPFGKDARPIYGLLAAASILTALWLYPSGKVGRGYCRSCKRYRRFHVVESRRIPDAEAASLFTAWAHEPRLLRPRFLLAWLGRSGTPK